MIVLLLGAFALGWLAGNWCLHRPDIAPEDRLHQAIIRAGQRNFFVRHYGAGALPENRN